jgi:hypothetical protein
MNGISQLTPEHQNLDRSDTAVILVSTTIAGLASFKDQIIKVNIWIFALRVA